MSDFDKYFPSKYLGARDILKPVVVTVKGSCEQSIKNRKNEEEIKLMLEFVETSKPLIMNMTNFKSMVKITKSDIVKSWIGTKVRLIVMDVATPDGNKPAIRIVEA